MEWAANPKHLGGIPRKAVFTAAGAFAKAMASIFNSTSVYNSETLIRLVRYRPPGTPLITVSNHMSTMDDPLMWGFKGFPSTDALLGRWVLAAEDICFKNKVYSYLFRLGKCIPITRGGGIYQEHMNEALHCLSEGGWVMPEKSFFGRRPPLPLCRKDIKIIIGDPMEFYLPTLIQTAQSMSRESSFASLGWPTTSQGLNEAAQRWLYTDISNRIRTVMENLRTYLVKSKGCDYSLRPNKDSAVCYFLRSYFTTQSYLGRRGI